MIADVKAPQVEMHCLYGSKVDTPGALQFPPNGFPDTYPKTIPDDGDGTVNMRSLEACLAWSGKQKQAVKHSVLEGAEHMAILSDQRTLRYITDFLTGGS